MKFKFLGKSKIFYINFATKIYKNQLKFFNTFIIIITTKVVIAIQINTAI